MRIENRRVNTPHTNILSNVTRNIFIFGVFLAFISGSSGIVSATTITVCSSGCDYSTIQACANAAQAGDTCRIQAGTYNEQVTIPRSGTASNPITFTADGDVWMDGSGTAINIGSNDYINIVGLKFRNYNIGINLGAGVNNITISDFEMYDLGDKGIDHHSGSRSSTTSSNITIKNGMFNKINNARSCGDDCIGFWGRATFVHLYNITIIDPGDQGVYFVYDTHNVIMERMHVEGAPWAGLKVHGRATRNPPPYIAYNITIKDSYIKGPSSIAGHDGLELHECCINATIENNVVIGHATDGIFLHNWGGDIYVRDNIIGTDGVLSTGGYYRSTQCAYYYASMYNCNWDRNIIYGSRYYDILTQSSTGSATDNIQVACHGGSHCPYGAISISGTVSGTKNINTASGTGYAMIASVPKGARIYLDTGSGLVDTGEVTPAVIPNLSPGPHDYRLELDGYHDATGSVTVVNDYSGWAIPIQVIMTPTSVPQAYGNISGTVEDTDNIPIEGATVTDGTRSDITDSNGEYLLENVPVGSYTVTASKNGYVSESKPVTVLENQTTNANFHLVVAVPPTITSYSPTDATPSQDEGSTNTFSVNTDQVVSNEWYLDTVQQSETSQSWTHTWSYLDAGEHNVTYVGSNVNGSVSQTWIVTVNDVVDTTPPTITIQNPESKTYSNKIISLNYTLDEVLVECSISVDGTANQTLPNCENQSVISREYESTSGEVGWWHLNNNASDSSGRGNDGTLNNGPIWVDGKFGKALSFDGDDDYVEVDNSLNISNEITLEAWVKASITGRHTIVEKWAYVGGAQRSFEFDIDSDRRVNFALSGDGSISNSEWLKSSGRVIPNTWTHVAATSDGTTMKIYINGELDPNTASSPVGIYQSTANLHIGRWWDGGSWYYPFNGIIDELRILNRALTADEILQDYALGLGSHSVTVYANDTAGNENSTTVYFAVGTGDTTPPAISNVQNASITGASAVITWDTDEVSDSLVKYSTSPGVYISSKSDATDVTSHSITLSGLTPETVYYYVVNSTDPSGNSAQSTEYSFTTGATSDTTPPTITKVRKKGITDTSAIITWDTDEASDSLVKYGISPGVYTYSESDAIDVTSHSIALSGLTPVTTYYYVVNSTDPSGNSAQSAEDSFTTETTSEINSTLVVNQTSPACANGSAYFSTIQSSINAASVNDTVIVCSGTYIENVDVDKQLNISSYSGPSVTIVNASNSLDHVLEVTADNVNISGFSVSGATGIKKAGIYLDHVSNCNLSNNIANLNNYGIYLDSSSNNILMDNAANLNNYGIYLDASSNNTMINNSASLNNLGIYLDSSSNNILMDNQMTDNDLNFLIDGRQDSHFNQSIDASNAVDGKPIYYLINNQNQVFDSSTNASFFACILCDNITVKDLNLLNNSHGVLFWKTNNSVVQNITASNSNYGIYLRSSNDNTIEDSTILNSTQYDFYSEQNSNNVVYDTYISTSTTRVSFEGLDIAVKSVSNPPADPSGLSSISKHLNLTNLTDTSPNSWIYLNISYTDAELGNITESTLKIYRYNGSWEQVPGSGVNTAANYVYANITNFSIFVPMGSVSSPSSNPPSTGSGGGGGGGGGRISPIPEGVSVLNSSLMKEIIRNLNLEYKFYFDAPKTLSGVMITSDEYPAVDEEVVSVLVRQIQTLQGDVYELAAEKILENFMYANTLYIARGDIPADSMAAVTYAKMKHVPIILTKTQELPEPTLKAINKLQPKKIIIVGGPMAISNEIEDKLSEMAEGERIWGETRYETSVEMANSFASYYKYFDTIVITDGNDPSTDAAIIASGYKAPLLYVRGNEIPQDVKTFLQDHKTEYFGRQMKVLLVGLSEDLKEEIESLMT